MQGREGEKLHVVRQGREDAGERGEEGAVQGRAGQGREDAGGTGFAGGRGPPLVAATVSDSESLLPSCHSVSRRATPATHTTAAPTLPTC